MNLPYLTRMNKTQSLTQVTQQKNTLIDQQSKALLTSSDLVIPPRQLISNSIPKKSFYTPNPTKTKPFHKQIFCYHNRVINSDPSNHSMSISLESSETPQRKISNRQKSKKSSTQQQTKIISRNTATQNIPLRQLERDSINQISQNGHIQITQEKKSYRKNHKKKMNMVPFRKCQSLIQERIVNAINRMDSGKECEKQLRSLNEKLRKLSIRQIMNRYVISGVNVVCRMAQQQKLQHKINSDIEMFLEETFTCLKKRISDELDNIDNFGCESVSECDSEQQTVDKGVLIRKLYKILKHKSKKECKTKLKNKSIKMACQIGEHQNFNLDIFLETLNSNKIK